MSHPTLGNSTSMPVANKAVRLQQTLHLLSPYLQRQRQTSQVVHRTVSPAGLERILGTLKPALQASRQRGDSADIWKIAGLGHDEVRNARVLAWLLDPAGSHGAGGTYLAALWERISGVSKLGFPLDGVERVMRENYPIGNGEHRIDIEIVGAQFVLFIEVKIYAGESKPNQVRDYAELAAAKANSLGKPHWAVLYLSEDRLEKIEKVIQFRWKDIARIIKANVRNMDGNAFSSRLALLFARHITRFH